MMFKIEESLQRQGFDKFQYETKRKVVPDVEMFTVH